MVNQTTSTERTAVGKNFFRHWGFQRGSKIKDGSGTSSSACGGARTGHIFVKKQISHNEENTSHSDQSSLVHQQQPKSSCCKLDAPAPQQIVVKPMIAPSPPVVSLQEHFDALLSSRGYSTEFFATLESAYHSKPTPMQLASYNIHVLEMIRQNNVAALKSLFAAGLSPNPATAHGESLVHLVCRRGEVDLLRFLMNAQGGDGSASVQIADNFGRTPMHTACWSSSPRLSEVFEIVRLLLDCDVHFFHMTDARGLGPLGFVRRELFQPWKEFLTSIVDVYWPANKSDSEKQQVPPLTLKSPNSRHIPDPKNGLTTQLAAMIATGKMTVEEAACFGYDQVDEYTNSCDDTDYGNYDQEECETLFYGMDLVEIKEPQSSTPHHTIDEIDADNEFSFNEDELADILNSFPCVASTESLVSKCIARSLAESNPLFPSPTLAP